MARGRKQCIVLIVEDDEPMQTMLQAFLRTPHGFYRPIVARNLSEATDLLCGGLRPDIALVDLHLPNGSGLEVPRQIVEASPHSRWPIVLTSGYYDDQYGEEALRLSPRIQTFIAKTRLSRDALQSILRHAILHTDLKQQLGHDVTLPAGLHGRFRRRWLKVEPYLWAATGACGGTLAVWEGGVRSLLTAKSVGAFFIAIAAAGLGIWKERRRKF